MIMKKRLKIGFSGKGCLLLKPVLWGGILSYSGAGNGTEAKTKKRLIHFHLDTS